MRVGSLLPSLLPLILLSGCTGGIFCDEVEAPCEKALEQRCHYWHNAIQTCLQNENGCMEWQDTGFCGEHDMCDESGDRPICACAHQCRQPGDTNCSGSMLQNCGADENGCLYWKDDKDCASRGQQCLEVDQIAQCGGGCANICSTLDATRCSGTRIQTCTVQQSECLDWQSGHDCNGDNQYCDDSTGSAVCADSCTDQCPDSSATRCSGDIIQNCAQGAGGCLYWVDATSCAEQSRYCDDTSGSATCVESCSNQCTPENSKRCNGSVPQTCTMAGGCLRWENGADCADSTQACVEESGDASCQDIGGDVELCGLCTAHNQCQGYTNTYGGHFCQPLQAGATQYYCLQDCTNNPDLCGGDTCNAQGNCIPESGCGSVVCSPSFPSGDCPPGLDCIEGECQDAAACSERNPTGTCPAGLDCIDGDCRQSQTGDVPIGGPCTNEAQCSAANATCYPEEYQGEGTGFLNGYCMVFECNENAPCPEGSSCVTVSGSTICVDDCTNQADCREGYGCMQAGSGTNVCFPSCQGDSCPDGYVCNDGSCVRADCTPGSCPGGEVCVNGRCVTEVGNGPGANTDFPLDQLHTLCNLPSMQCEAGATACAQLGRFDPVQGFGYADYPENGETESNQYRSYLRRDARMLITYGTAYVDCLAANWPVGNRFCHSNNQYSSTRCQTDDNCSGGQTCKEMPLGLIDMSEANGDIPGTSDRYCVDEQYRYNTCQTQADCAQGRTCKSSPGHPEGTHVNGHDIDVSYYQIDTPDNAARPICVHTTDGQEQYHCTAEPHLLDPWRTALFLGAIFDHPSIRIVGCDGQAGQLLDSAMRQLCSNGWLSAYACGRLNRLTYEVENENRGWFRFHHHHMHVSFGSPNYMNGGWPQSCLVPGCANGPLERFLKSHGLEMGDPMPRLRLQY